MAASDRREYGPVHRLQWRAPRLLAFLAIYAAIPGQSYADQAQEIADDSRSQVLIIVEAAQQELLGPHAMAGPSLADDIPLLDIVREYSRNQGDAAVFVRESQETLGTFDFHDAVLNSIANLDDNASWHLAEVEVINEAKYPGRGTQTQVRAAYRMFGIGSYDYVLFVKSVYFITPGLDQLRLWIELDVYFRDRSLPLFERNYQYLSQSRGDLFRPFRDGEKEAMIEEIDNQYKRKVEQFPKNQISYSKDRSRALDALEDREVILPIMAFSEGWPGNSFTVELQLATDRVFAMMKEDLHVIPADQVEDQEYVLFNGFDLKGRPEVFEGYVAGSQGLNTIYRDAEGNMYSVP